MATRASAAAAELDVGVFRIGVSSGGGGGGRQVGGPALPAPQRWCGSRAWGCAGSRTSGTRHTGCDSRGCAARHRCSRTGRAARRAVLDIATTVGGGIEQAKLFRLLALEVRAKLLVRPRRMPSLYFRPRMVPRPIAQARSIFGRRWGSPSGWYKPKWETTVDCAVRSPHLVLDYKLTTIKVIHRGQSGCCALTPKPYCPL